MSDETNSSDAEIPSAATVSAAFGGPALVSEVPPESAIPITGEATTPPVADATVETAAVVDAGVAVEALTPAAPEAVTEVVAPAAPAEDDRPIVINLPPVPTGLAVEPIFVQNTPLPETVQEPVVYIPNPVPVLPAPTAQPELPPDREPTTEQKEILDRYGVWAHFVQDGNYWNIYQGVRRIGVHADADLAEWETRASSISVVPRKEG